MTATTALSFVAGIAILYVVLGRDVFRTMAHVTGAVLLFAIVRAIQGLLALI